MKVGDIVVQGSRVIKLGGNLENKRSKMKGTVIAIHEDTFPKEWEDNDYRKSWLKTIGRRVDVMWASGKVSESFAENSLEIINKDR